jgi:hypothetical protein
MRTRSRLSPGIDLSFFTGIPLSSRMRSRIAAPIRCLPRRISD